MLKNVADTAFQATLISCIFVLQQQQPKRDTSKSSEPEQTAGHTLPNAASLTFLLFGASRSTSHTNASDVGQKPYVFACPSTIAGTDGMGGETFSLKVVPTLQT